MHSYHWLRHHRLRHPAGVGLAVLRMGGTILGMGAMVGCGGGHPTASPAAPVPPAPALRHFTYANLGPAGALGARVTGINEAGQIVGQVNTGPDAPPSAFRHSGTGPLTKADILGTFPGAGPGTASYATGINASGVVAGYVILKVNGQPFARAFTFDHAFQDLQGSDKPFVSSLTQAINDRGQTAGVVGPVRHAFRHSGGPPLTVWDDLGVFGAYGITEATSLNASGLVVGLAKTVLMTTHGFAFDSQFHDLGTLSGPESGANDVNDRGQITGFSDIDRAALVVHAFRHTGTAPLAPQDDLGVLPGFETSVGLAINNQGAVVGFLRGGPQGKDGDSAFLCPSDGVIQNLNDRTLVTNLPAGVRLATAKAINDKGQIAGESFAAGKFFVWLLTPSL